MASASRSPSGVISAHQVEDHQSTLHGREFTAGAVKRAHVMVVALLLVHVVLVGWLALRWSPTVDEVAHLPAGLSHWRFMRFDLYRVNPPLIRMIAAIPLLFCSPPVDWSSFSEQPYARPEFSIGHSFVRNNGREIFWYFTLARWACLPVSLLGAWVCYHWGKELSGTGSGVIALTLYCFCPNIIGNAALITPDVGATAFGVTAGYCFWRWLHYPTAVNMGLAGLSLGLAELTKSTWIILFALWPVLTLVWEFEELPSTSKNQNFRPLEAVQKKISSRYSLRCMQLVGILLLGWYILNVGYGFEKSFQRLDHFQFISRVLGGSEAHTTPANRFA